MEFLVELGYQEEDVQRAHFGINLELSEERVFRFRKKGDYWIKLYKFPTVELIRHQVILKYLPRLRQLVEAERFTRLERGRKARLALREAKIRELYEKFKVSIDPLDWAHLPNLERIYKLRPISDYICTDNLKIVRLSEEAIDCISHFVDGWMANAKSQLFRILPEEFVSKLGALERENWLDLACAVFVCPVRGHCAEPALIGWKGIGHHLNCVAQTDPEGHSDFATFSFRFSLAGSRAASILAARLGLDHSTARSSDLDSRTMRFICTHCPLILKTGMKGRHVLTWKECVRHPFGNT